MPTDDVETIVGMLQEELHDNCQDEEEEETVCLEQLSSAEILQTVEVIKRALYATDATSSIHSHFSTVENHLLTRSVSLGMQTTLEHLWQRN